MTYDKPRIERQTLVAWMRTDFSSKCAAEGGIIVGDKCLLPDE